MNDQAETLRRMARARIETPHVILAAATDWNALRYEAKCLNEAADLIESQRQRIERLERIVGKIGGA